jgi:hypothetical protein
MDLKLVAQALEAKEKITDFPNKGDNKAVSLSNSKYKTFPVSEGNSIRDNYPKIWGSGGTGGKGKDKTSFTGGNAWSNYLKYKSGDRSESVLNWVKRRERFFDRHKNNGTSIASVISWVKWGGVGNKGIAHMRKMISEAKNKYKGK